jgi:cystathionine gamma-synthase
MANMHPSTQAVHLGRPAQTPDEPLNTPITMASVFQGGGDREYGRFGNPTWTAFEEALGGLEGGRCLAFSSGMAAVVTVLDLVGLGAKVVAPKHCYNGTLAHLADLELRGRAQVHLVDVTNTEEVAAACQDAALVWMESPTNPALEVADLPAIINAAHDAGAHVVVDNTFATPLRQKPLELGADVVVHSATKYISGHSDVLMGAVITADDEIQGVLKGRRDLQGAVPGPFETWLALRGLRTLPVRFDRAEANAAELAKRLAEHPSIDEVRYPGFGAIVAMILPDPVKADVVQNTTELWTFATSLGGVESTLERRRRWSIETNTIPEGLVRLSVGIEDIEDLWGDLKQALDATLG